MDTIVSVLREHYTKDPNWIFCKFIAKDNLEEISYRKLIENASSYALHYKNCGVSKGDCVLIILKHSPHLFYSFIGAMMVGAIPSILPFPSEKQDINIYHDSMEKLSKRIKAKSIITYKENIDEIKQIGKDLGIDTSTIEQFKPIKQIFWNDDIEENEIVFLQHSSGTTGLKKGVALSHKSVLNQIENYSTSIKLDNKDVIISWLPLYHDMGLIACFILPLMKKTLLIMMDPFEWVIKPKMLFEHIEKFKATLCWLPNFAYNFLVRCIDKETETYDLSSMRAFIDCSEPCKQHSFQIFYEAFKNYGVKKEALQTCYAMAENVFGITQSDIGKTVKVDWLDKNEFTQWHFAKKSTESKNALSFISCGRAIQNTKIMIVDSNRKEVRERQVGEITVSSNSLFSGYFKLQQESAKVIENEWFFTGDLGYIAEGELYITGRKKDLLIVQGKNYYAHDIEYISNHISGIKKGRCVAIEVYNDIMGTEEAVLIAETEASTEGEKRKIANEIKKKVSGELNLALWEVYLVPLKWIVKTTSGKISRNENKKKYLKERFNKDSEA